MLSFLKSLTASDTRLAVLESVTAVMLLVIARSCVVQMFFRRVSAGACLPARFCWFVSGGTFAPARVCRHVFFCFVEAFFCGSVFPRAFVMERFGWSVFSSISREPHFMPGGGPRSFQNQSKEQAPVPFSLKLDKKSAQLCTGASYVERFCWSVF